MSKDPELSKLINEVSYKTFVPVVVEDKCLLQIDPKFPLAVNRMPCNLEGCGPSTAKDPLVDNISVETPETFFNPNSDSFCAKPVYFAKKRR